MSQKKVAGHSIDVDANGYMTDMSQWNKEIAAALAKEEGIDKLTDKHWAVIDYIQKSVKAGEALTIRKLGKSGIVDTKEFYELFPEGPLKKATLISGVPKPAGCI
jgi:tRNA 2-thiouridine synthesizing protein E